MYRTFCNNLCCLFIAVILSGMAAGPVHGQKQDGDSSFSACFPDAASMELALMMNQDTLRSATPASENSMETYTWSGSFQAPCQMIHKCQAHSLGCLHSSLTKAGYLHGNTMSSRAESSSNPDDYIFALGQIRV